MAAPQPEPAVHTGPWTLEEWLALPQGPPYTELVDGLLVMSPVSAYRHQRLMVRLWQQLDAAAPPEYEVMPGYVERARSEDGLLRFDRPFRVQLALTLPTPPAAG